MRWEWVGTESIRVWRGVVAGVAYADDGVARAGMAWMRRITIIRATRVLITISRTK
jgi:hypothetical protein